MPSQPNKVELIGYYGSDETHALSAWTSTTRNLIMISIFQLQY